MAVSGSAMVLYDPRAADPEATAVFGFLGGHKGRTREAYELDLRQFGLWCAHRGLRLFEVTRVDIERFARDLEQSGRAPATIGRRLATVTGLYRFAEEEGLIEHSPSGACPPTPSGSRIPCRRVGPQRARRLPGGRGDQLATRARPRVPARVERLARVRSPRRRCRRSRFAARPSHLVRVPQGQQDGHRPAGAAHRPRR